MSSSLEASEQQKVVLKSQLVAASEEEAATVCIKINNNNEDENSSGSSDEDCDQGSDTSVLKIMAQNHRDITKTVSIIKKEIVKYKLDELPNGEEGSCSNSKSNTNNDIESKPRNLSPVQSGELDGLNNFLSDNGVQKIIQSVVGSNTSSVIKQTLGAVNSGKSIQEKRALLSGGLRQLHNDLRNSNNSRTVTNDPLFALALGVAGLNRKAINLD